MIPLRKEGLVMNTIPIALSKSPMTIRTLKRSRFIMTPTNREIGPHVAYMATESPAPIAVSNRENRGDLKIENEDVTTAIAMENE